MGGVFSDVWQGDKKTSERWSTWQILTADVRAELARNSSSPPWPSQCSHWHCQQSIGKLQTSRQFSADKVSQHNGWRLGWSLYMKVLYQQPSAKGVVTLSSKSQFKFESRGDLVGQQWGLYRTHTSHFTPLAMISSYPGNASHNTHLLWYCPHN